MWQQVNVLTTLVSDIFIFSVVTKTVFFMYVIFKINTFKIAMRGNLKKPIVVIKGIVNINHSYSHCPFL